MGFYTSCDVNIDVPFLTSCLSKCKEDKFVEFAFILVHSRLLYSKWYLLFFAFLIIKQFLSCAAELL